MKEIMEKKTKVCNHCGVEKELHEFNKNGREEDGFDRRCRECNRLYYAKRRISKKEYKPFGKINERFKLGYKTCSKCNIEKKLDQFYKQTNSSDGLKAWCKICSNKYIREFNKKKQLEDPISYRRKKRKYYENSRANPLYVKKKRAYDKKRWRDPIMGKKKREYYSNRWNDEDFRRGKRQSLLKYYYGMTLEQYDKMLADQGGGCKICGAKDSGMGKKARIHLSVDHVPNSDPVIVRGLLCHKCNSLLGLARDNPDILEIGAKYIRNKGKI